MDEKKKIWREREGFKKCITERRKVKEKNIYIYTSYLL